MYLDKLKLNLDGIQMPVLLPLYHLGEAPLGGLSGASLSESLFYPLLAAGCHNLLGDGYVRVVRRMDEVWKLGSSLLVPISG